MPYKDREQERASSAERCRKYRRRKHEERFGPNAGSMTGKHKNHAKGENNGRWNGGKMRTSQGYIAIAVPEGHHLRQAHGYAYEHQIVAEETLGRRLEFNEIVHHKNGKRSDNRPENLEVQIINEHAALHSSSPDARDKRTGRFKSGKRH